MQRFIYRKLCPMLGLLVLSACGGGSIDSILKTIANGPEKPLVGANGVISNSGISNGGANSGGVTDGSSANASNIVDASFANACGSSAEVLFAGSEKARVDANVEVIALACGAPINSPKWIQISGDTVNFLSGRSQAISFLPNSSGTREFTFSYKNGQGIDQSRTVRINVAPSVAQVAAIIRGEPSVWAGNATSLRVWLPGVSDTALSSASYQWKLLSLTTSKLENANSPNAIITPSDVTGDTVVPVQADIQLADGRNWTQRFDLLVQKPDPTARNSPAYDDASQVYPYVVVGNPYANILKKCIYARSIAFYYSTICKMSTLPVLGQSAAAAIPSVEEVMQRVLVSNDWMGANFERFLREQDTNGQIRRMLASTTAVVIGGRIRPSFYTPWTGAIHLDADDLWLTAEQRDTISEMPDYRVELSKPFSFELSYTYYKPIQGKDSTYISIESRQTRLLTDLRKGLFALMVHELTHAADDVPPSIVRTLDPDQYLYQAVDSRINTKANATAILGATYPLSCRECFKLGAVLFEGVEPTSAQTALTASQIAQWFVADYANDFYAYSVTNPETEFVSAEDSAMLVEEALMQLTYGFKRYAYIVSDVNGTYGFPWGQAGRIGNPAIRRRAALVLRNTAPWFDQSRLTDLEEPINLVPSSNSPLAVMKASVPNYFSQMQLQQQIEKQRHARDLRMRFKNQLQRNLNAVRAGTNIPVN